MKALTLDGLKSFYIKYIKPIKNAAYCTVVNNGTTTASNTVLDGRMGKTLADKDANLQNQIDTLNSTLGDTTSIKHIMIANKRGIQVGTTPSMITVPFKCPSNPIAIIPHAHGGAPFMCSVNSWTTTDAVISVEAKQTLTNRIVVLAIIY